MTDTHAHVLAARVIASGPWNTPADLAHHVVDTLLADGYRRTWTITTAAEVEALPEGTVVLVQGIAWQSESDGWLTAGITRHMRPYELIESAAGHYGTHGPITVIHAQEH